MTKYAQQEWHVNTAVDAPRGGYLVPLVTQKIDRGPKDVVTERGHPATKELWQREVGCWGAAIWLEP